VAERTKATVLKTVSGTRFRKPLRAKESATPDSLGDDGRALDWDAS